MLCFGLGTLPAMLATSFGAANIQQFLRRRGLKVFIALFLIGSGIWTIYLTAAHSGHSGGHVPGMIRHMTAAVTAMGCG